MTEQQQGPYRFPIPGNVRKDCTECGQQGTAQRTRTGPNIPPLTDSLQVFGLASILVLPASPIGWERANALCKQGIWYLTAAWIIR